MIVILVLILSSSYSSNTPLLPENVDETLKMPQTFPNCISRAQFKRISALLLLTSSNLAGFSCYQSSTQPTSVELNSEASPFAIGLLESLVPETTICFRTGPQTIESAENKFNLTALKDSVAELMDSVDKTKCGRLLHTKECEQLQAVCEQETNALHRWDWIVPILHDWNRCVSETQNRCVPDWGPFFFNSIDRHNLRCVPNYNIHAPDRSCQYYKLAKEEIAKAKDAKIEAALKKMGEGLIPIKSLSFALKTEAENCLQEREELEKVVEAVEILMAGGTIGMAMTNLGVSAIAITNVGEDVALVVSVAREFEALVAAFKGKNWEVVGRNLGAILLKIFEVVEFSK